MNIILCQRVPRDSICSRRIVPRMQAQDQASENNFKDGLEERKPTTAELDRDPKYDHVEKRSRGRKVLDTIYWVPPWCRYDLENPPKFTIWHNILFAFAGAFTVANLYYNHAILNILAEEFHVSQAVVSRVPTLMQAGYATGVLFILPLGDMVPRRHLTLSCILFTATMW